MEDEATPTTVAWRVGRTAVRRRLPEQSVGLRNNQGVDHPGGLSESLEKRRGRTVSALTSTRQKLEELER